MSAPLTVREFSEALGFGDGTTEPAATLKDLVYPLTQALHDSQQHTECPIVCEPCGELLADTLCAHCGGGGANAIASEAAGAWEECEWCAGAGKVHPGCVEISYSDLAGFYRTVMAAVSELEQIAAGRPSSYSDGVTAATKYVRRSLEGDSHGHG